MQLDLLLMCRGKLFLRGIQEHQAESGACHYWAGQLPRGCSVYLLGWNHPLPSHALIACFSCANPHECNYQHGALVSTALPHAEKGENCRWDSAFLSLTG